MTEASRTAVLHYHLFKNAGTSLDHILKKNYGSGWVTREFTPKGGPRGNTAEVEAWIDETPEAVAYSSHTMQGPVPDVPGVDLISVILLRDPISRIQSAYEFEKKQGVETFGSIVARHTTFEGYVDIHLAMKAQRQCRNFQTHRLASMSPGPEPELTRARRALQNISVVGLVSNFAGTLRRLERKLGAAGQAFAWDETRRNTAKGEKPPIAEETQQKLLAANADDLALLADLEAVRRQSA